MLELAFFYQQALNNQASLADKKLLYVPEAAVTSSVLVSES